MKRSLATVAVYAVGAVAIAGLSVGASAFLWSCIASASVPTHAFPASPSGASQPPVAAASLPIEGVPATLRLRTLRGHAPSIYDGLPAKSFAQPGDRDSAEPNTPANAATDDDPTAPALLSLDPRGVYAAASIEYGWPFRSLAADYQLPVSRVAGTPLTQSVIGIDERPWNVTRGAVTRFHRVSVWLGPFPASFSEECFGFLPAAAPTRILWSGALANLAAFTPVAAMMLAILHRRARAYTSRWRRFRAGWCANCGYDARHLHPCPECASRLTGGTARRLAARERLWLYRRVHPLGRLATHTLFVAIVGGTLSTAFATLVYLFLAEQGPVRTIHYSSGPPDRPQWHAQELWSPGFDLISRYVILTKDPALFDEPGGYPRLDRATNPAQTHIRPPYWARYTWPPAAESGSAASFTLAYGWPMPALAADYTRDEHTTEWAPRSPLAWNPIGDGNVVSSLGPYTNRPTPKVFPTRVVWVGTLANALFFGTRALIAPRVWRVIRELVIGI